MNHNVQFEDANQIFVEAIVQKSRDEGTFCSEICSVTALVCGYEVDILEATMSNKLAREALEDAVVREYEGC